MTDRSKILTYPDKHGELEQSRHWIHSAQKRRKNDSTSLNTDLSKCNFSTKPNGKNDSLDQQAATSLLAVYGSVLKQHRTNGILTETKMDRTKRKSAPRLSISARRRSWGSPPWCELPGTSWRRRLYSWNTVNDTNHLGTCSDPHQLNEMTVKGRRNHHHHVKTLFSLHLLIIIMSQHPCLIIITNR